jgi:hypothetical protein
MFVLTGFFLAIFGTMCVQLFGGQLRGRCGFPDFSGAYTDAEGLVHVSGRRSTSLTMHGVAFGHSFSIPGVIHLNE